MMMLNAMRRSKIGWCVVFSGTMLVCAAKGCAAVRDCDTYLDFWSLAFGVCCRDAFPEGFQAPNLCLEAFFGAHLPDFRWT